MIDCCADKDEMCIETSFKQIALAILKGFFIWFIASSIVIMLTIIGIKSVLVGILLFTVALVLTVVETLRII
jgi:hypothetical protein